MNNFNGLVKAKYYDLEKALDNWNNAYNEAKEKKKQLLELAKTETISYKVLWFIPITKTKYKYIKDNVSWDGKYWTVEQALVDIYPEQFTVAMKEISHNFGYFSDIEAMIKINMDEVYLSAEQAAKVVRWSIKYD